MIFSHKLALFPGIADVLEPIVPVTNQVDINAWYPCPAGCIVAKPRNSGLFRGFGSYFFGFFLMILCEFTVHASDSRLRKIVVSVI